MMSIKSLKGKLSLYILECTAPQSRSFTLKRTQTQLAEYFGVQRPSLARTLGELIREGTSGYIKESLPYSTGVNLRRCYEGLTEIKSYICQRKEKSYIHKLFLSHE
ncbi:MAG: helix-turn-helix domain-containing protein [Porphyromonadaceae bacterium]|nr:helix-turn-helix domain-containing protein [Porphyromonadaceae bacterium]